jgi:sugar lactone lactonase YvrE
MEKRVNNLLVCVAICALAVSITSNAQAQNLFEADEVSGHIYQFTPGGAQSTFASGLGRPVGLAFDSAGNLFEADYGTGHIYEFTPGGSQSAFASGLNNPAFLAFQVPEPTTWSLLALGAVALVGGLRLRRRS